MNNEIIKKYNIKAKKALGQNFLVNNEILKQIVNITNIENKNIIEVWPWYWALTEKILEKKPKNLELIELDKDMINILNDRIKNNDLKIQNTNITIKNIDVLKYYPNFDNYIVIANIPYYITSPILQHFLYSQKNKSKEMIILMQKDVWDKIINKEKNSVLSLMIEKKAFASEKIFVWKENFIPSPKVESSVIYFQSHNLYNNINDELFLKTIKIWFSSPRKKLIKNFVNHWYKKEQILQIMQQINLSWNERPEELNIEKWILFMKLLNNVWI